MADVPDAIETLAEAIALVEHLDQVIQQHRRALGVLVQTRRTALRILAARRDGAEAALAAAEGHCPPGSGLIQ